MEIDEVLREYDPQFTENIDGEVSKIGHMEAYQLHIGLESFRLFLQSICFSEQYFDHPLHLLTLI